MSGYLRKIFFETYPGDESGCNSYICTSSSSACSKLKTWKSDFSNYYSGYYNYYSFLLLLLLLLIIIHFYY